MATGTVTVSRAFGSRWRGRVVGILAAAHASAACVVTTPQPTAAQRREAAIRQAFQARRAADREAALERQQRLEDMRRERAMPDAARAMFQAERDEQAHAELQALCEPGREARRRDAASYPERLAAWEARRDEVLAWAEAHCHWVDTTRPELVAYRVNGLVVLREIERGGLDFRCNTKVGRPPELDASYVRNNGFGRPVDPTQDPLHHRCDAYDRDVENAWLKP
jgi:hypothetical protein